MDNDKVIAENVEPAAADEAAAEAPKKVTRTRRKAAPRAKAADAGTAAPDTVVPESLTAGAAPDTVAAEASADAGEALAKTPVRRTRARKKVAEEPLPAFAEGAGAEVEAQEAGAPVAAPEQAAPAGEPAAESKPVRRRRTTKAKATEPTESAAESAESAEAPAAGVAVTAAEVPAAGQAEAPAPVAAAHTTPEPTTP